jgi:hypothetical protein
MARTFNIYKGAEKLASGASPVALTALVASTKYDLEISAVENGVESTKVTVPSFTTLVSEG